MSEGKKNLIKISFSAFFVLWVEMKTSESPERWDGLFGLSNTLLDWFRIEENMGEESRNEFVDEIFINQNQLALTLAWRRRPEAQWKVPP